MLGTMATLVAGYTPLKYHEKYWATSNKHCAFTLWIYNGFVTHAAVLRFLHAISTYRSKGLSLRFAFSILNSKFYVSLFIHYLKLFTLMKPIIRSSVCFVWKTLVVGDVSECQCSKKNANVIYVRVCHIPYAGFHIVLSLTSFGLELTIYLKLGR